MRRSGGGAISHPKLAAGIGDEAVAWINRQGDVPVSAYPAKDVSHAAEMGAPIFHRREERDLYSLRKN
jgi:hypothetical protein